MGLEFGHYCPNTKPPKWSGWREDLGGLLSPCGAQEVARLDLSSGKTERSTPMEIPIPMLASFADKKLLGCLRSKSGVPTEVVQETSEETIQLVYKKFKTLLSLASNGIGDRELAGHTLAMGREIEALARPWILGILEVPHMIAEASARGAKTVVVHATQAVNIIPQQSAFAQAFQVWGSVVVSDKIPQGKIVDKRTKSSDPVRGYDKVHPL